MSIYQRRYLKSSRNNGTTMFAQRFDPAAYFDAAPEAPAPKEEKSRKRRLSEALISSDDDDEDDDEVAATKENAASEEDNDAESDSEISAESLDNEVVEPVEDSAEIEAPTVEDSMEVDEKPAEEEEQPIENDPNYVSKHLSIFQKFQSAIPKDDEFSLAESDSDSDVEKQNLAPLPQPALPRDRRLVSNQAHLKNLEWLATPQYFSPELTKPFDQFLLSKRLQENLSAAGYKDAFSVQLSVLDLLLEDIKKNKFLPDFRGDLLVNASTGSGKTLAYLIPIIEALIPRKVPRLRAIILVPTRPLINQVRATLDQLSKGSNLLIVTLKSDLSIKEEGRKIQQNEPDILVSTPGRLVEHLSNNSIDLKYLRFLVIDEADRLLNQSFQNWCQVLVSSIERHHTTESNNVANSWLLRPQKLIFSATLTTDAGKLALLKFEKPRLVVVNTEDRLVNELFSVPPTLSEFSISLGTAKSGLKPLILAKFLQSQNKLSNVLVFTKSNEASLRLSKLLSFIFRGELNIQHINSTNNTSSVRNKILKDFSTQTINILVATDLIARGIDIASITDVVNYDLPNSSREYVHRVGRTARANQTGSAYSLCFGKGEKKFFTKTMKEVGRGSKEIEEIPFSMSLISESDNQMYNEALQQLQAQVFDRK